MSPAMNSFCSGHCLDATELIFSSKSKTKFEMSVVHHNMTMTTAQICRGQLPNLTKVHSFMYLCTHIIRQTQSNLHNGIYPSIHSSIFLLNWLLFLYAIGRFGAAFLISSFARLFPPPLFELISVKFWVLRAHSTGEMCLVLNLNGMRMNWPLSMLK